MRACTSGAEPIATAEPGSASWGDQGSAVRAVAAAMVALLLLYGCWQAFGLTPRHRALVDHLFFLTAWLTASGAALAASRRCRGVPRMRASWRLIALASVAYLGRSLFGTAFELAGRRPDATVGDVLSLPFYPLLGWGLLCLPRVRRSAAERVRLHLDAAIVAVGGSAVALYMVLGIAGGDARSGILQSPILILYLLGDMILLIGLARLCLSSPPPSSHLAMRLLALGLLFYVVGNLAYCYSSVRSSYRTGAPIDSLALVAVAVLAIAGAAQRPVRDREDLTLAAPSQRVSRLPYFAVAIAFALLIFVQRGANLAGISPTLAVLLLVGLVSARQYLTQRDLLNTQEQLTHLSLHDGLTGLANRALVADRAEYLLARARRHRLPAAALYVDLDGFKSVNDTFGHAAGDELLKVIASRLLDVVRESDTVGRISGDEFVLLLEGTETDRGPELLAERVLEVLRMPFDLRGVGGRLHSMTASVGIATGTECSAQELFRDADSALYEAKRLGRNRAVLFEPAMQASVKDRLELSVDLKDALARGEFFLLYQPTVDLRTRAVTGTEALIRWRHPTRGVVMPDRFIPLLEESGMIVPVGRWVLDTACRQSAEWRARGHRLRMHVNVSTRQFERDELVSDVRGALAQARLDPPALTLEVTETGLMRDPELVAERLTSLKALGVEIAIDDFGTGYSSLAYLARFPASVLKIDRSFISGMAASPESGAAIIHTLIQLGKSLGLKTFGEGIENDAQLDLLRSEECDLGQGFLFARPLSADAVMQLLDERPARGGELSPPAQAVRRH